MVQINGQNIGSPFAIVDTDGRVYTNSLITTTDPTDASKYNPSVVFAYSGTEIGSIFKINSTGSVVSVFEYDGSGNIAKIGSWVGL